ncbi:hypothetical protein HPP92_011118 [Vanilla planifolia]|uniref:DRBM domain-containing protein n=2 Tax=Vanilla planifolia TaxID=51239 RepID=A0A835R279_VANPL|nr:hypothetical protein HPP92_011381 [Vanilla planifolia]KAG0483034.1 hypothetical protein HPP92_011118 [Vanilla planifolia]
MEEISAAFVSSRTACYSHPEAAERSTRVLHTPLSSEFRESSSSNGQNVLESSIGRAYPSLTSFSGGNGPVVANCYVFKSRLQEYAQKVGIPTPVYDTLMEGPSHVPVFRSTVIVNNVKYNSLPGFFNRKAAEQSAAEVALLELTKSGEMTEYIPTVHETGLCKNLLQEYAQKMNYAMPTYNCTKQVTGTNNFTCTVEINGIQYIGAAARTKKEAEIKAARTALLAIQSASLAGSNGISPYTVLPSQKKGKEAEQPQPEAPKQKSKRTKFKKKWSKRTLRKRKDDNLAKLVTGTIELGSKVDGLARFGDANMPEMDALEQEMKVQLQGQEVHENGSYT